jgi:carboxymethylenebutenolidase
MSDNRHPAATADVARRDFVLLSAAAGLVAAGSRAEAAAAAAVTQSSAAAAVESREVEIKTPDGTSDAAFFCQPGKTLPGVLLWCDAFGLRPWTREMGKRLAASGYSVLVPNPFYRTDRAPQYTDVHSFNFGNPDDRQKLFSHMGTLNQPGNPEKDATAYVAWLDAQKEVSRTSKIGTQGYCMGGPLIMRTAAALPERIGAAASFHGGGLVTDKPESPHLLIPKIKAQLYIGIAANDDAKEPDAKARLREAFDAAHVKAEIEVYPDSVHGWCMKDMPNQENGKPGYNEVDAERAWAKLLALYKATLG